MNLFKRILRFEFHENAIALKVVAASITLRLKKKTIYRVQYLVDSAVLSEP